MIVLKKRYSIFLVLLIWPWFFSCNTIQDLGKTTIEDFTHNEITEILNKGEMNKIDMQRERYVSLIKLNLTEIKNDIE